MGTLAIARRGIFAALCACVITTAATAARPPAGYPAKSDVLGAFNRVLPAKHPYLLYGSGGADEFLERISRQGVPAMFALREGVVSRADALMDEPAFPRTVVGKRMLTDIGARCHLLAAAYLATCEEKYARRCIAEMLAAADYPDWHPSHFLDVAMVGLGVAIGYDACWNAMTAEERVKVSNALYEKCIVPSDKHWFWTSPGNWSQVCGCGVAAAALAIARDDGRLESSAQVVADCCRAAKAGAAAYAPCGAFPEGPAYWSYGTDYYVLFMDMLEKTCGKNFGLYGMPGVSETGAFIDAITAPSGMFFDFSDRNSSADVFSRCIEWSMFWLGAKSGHREWYAYENEKLAKSGCANVGKAGWPIPCVMWWRSDSMPRRPVEGAAYFHHDSQPVGVMGDASNWVALKGGRASYSHGHMDAGSFVYETYGDGWAERWVCEGGTENYNTLETAGIDVWNMAQSSTRWSVFRYGPKAHSVFTIDDKQPQVDALVTLRKNGDSEFVADTAALYPECAASAKRTFALREGKLAVTDTFDGVSTGHTYRWAFPTRARAVVADGGVVLSSGGRRMFVSASCDGEWSVESEPRGTLDFETQNKGLNRVVFASPLRSGRYEFTFKMMEPVDSNGKRGFWSWLKSLF